MNQLAEDHEQPREERARLRREKLREERARLRRMLAWLDRKIAEDCTQKLERSDSN